jgi:hypothetical protein
MEKHDKCGSRTHKRVTQVTQISLVSSILILFNLLNEIDNAAPQLGALDLRERSDQRQASPGDHQFGPRIRRRQRIPRIRRGGKLRHPFKEERYWDLQDARDLLQPTRPNPIGASLIFVQLLAGYSYRFPKYC